jgi:CubicO group peptidase (beta-lactamase class C family)
MNRLTPLLFLICITSAVFVRADDALSKTLMTTRGKLLVSEDFTKPLTPFTGKPVGFASGFSGWKYNGGPGTGKGGRWEIVDGTFKGIENPEAHHPATASFGYQFKDAIIQCDVRLNDVPAEGRLYRSLFVKATDAKDYVISLSLGQGGLFLTPYDSDRINPATKQREKGPSSKALTKIKLNEWHTVVLEIRGNEVVGTLDNKSTTTSNPLIGTDKHSIMLGVGTEASFRNLRVWEALPNPDWPKNKQMLLAASKPAAQDVFRTDKLADMDAVIEDAIKEAQIVGAALWVERDGVAYHKAFGQRAATPAAEAMTEETIVDLASVTKVMAGTSAAMLCVERGLMNVDDLVSKHLPEFAGEGREKITIRHLLLHSSGLPVNLNSTLPPFVSHADAMAQACHTKLLFEPGTAFSYSSAGTMVLGGVIERVTGRTFDEFCTTEVFKPLGMNDTVFRPSGDRLRRVAPTDFPERGKVNDTVARLVGGVAAHASLFSTTADMARFARMMLNLGELEGVRVFKPETVKLFTSVQNPPGLTSPDAKNLPVHRALGWDISTPYRTPPHDYTLARGALFPIGSYGHTGWTGQMLWIDPFSRTFVIFLCNRYGGGVGDTRPFVYQMHHRLSTLAAEALKGFDFNKVPGALPNQRTDGNATKDKSFTNSLGMKFVPVPETGILMCIHETRLADYAAYAASEPAADASWKNAVIEAVPVGAGNDEPVVNVSWDDAKAFCEWLGKKEGRTYRLPTDREWSVAVGIGEYEPVSGATPESLSTKLKDVYPWGRQWPPIKGAGNYADEDCKKLFKSEKTVEGYADGFAVTAPVMSFPPNEFGIYDLGGSVWEWCEDWLNAEKKLHVLRGASWGSSARAPLLSSFRGSQTADRRWRCDGFRCVLVAAP